MKNSIVVAALFVATFSSTAIAHGSKNVKLHVNPRWKECSFQLDPSLTQQAWHQFTHEAGMVAYFRPLVDAQPMGKWNFEVSALQWATAFNDEDAAWNDTFVHPDSTHWLKKGERLAFPGLMVRGGVTDEIDAGIYFTKNPNANYGFWGVQVQYNFVNEAQYGLAVASRATVSSLFGPEDVGFQIYGLDVLTSKKYETYSDWISVIPYAGASVHLTTSHETSSVVTLHDETIAGVQGMVGAIAQISFVKLAVEYNVATVTSLSVKIGIGF